MVYCKTVGVQAWTSFKRNHNVSLYLEFVVKELSLPINKRMTKVEKGLMLGKGKWIADFNESFRNFRVRDVEFDVFIRGNTRMKGFVLSRLFSIMLNPNYSVGCFMVSTESLKHFDRKLLGKALAEIQSYMKDNEMKWSWFFIFTSRGIGEMGKHVENIGDQSIGVVFVDAKSGSVVHSNSYLGRQAKSYVKL